MSVDFDVLNVIPNTPPGPVLTPNPRRGRTFAARLWQAAWPKLLAIAIVIGGWQLLVMSGWKSEVILPSPFTVFQTFFENFDQLFEGTRTTLARALKGYTLAILIGGGIGVLVTRSRILRAAIGSMITGLQTMPSIAWFPLAIVLWGFNETAILFVVVIGAAPSIANGLIYGIDQIPPVLLRAGRSLGAKGFTFVRYVVVPAAFPSFIGGLKQGWAFAWRSLLAGELLVLIAGQRSLGQTLQNERLVHDYDAMYAVMIAIFIVGVLVDSLAFGNLERWVRKRYGLVDSAQT